MANTTFPTALNLEPVNFGGSFRLPVCSVALMLLSGQLASASKLRSSFAPSLASELVLRAFSTDISPSLRDPSVQKQSRLPSSDAGSDSIETPECSTKGLSSDVLTRSTFIQTLITIRPGLLDSPISWTCGCNKAGMHHSTGGRGLDRVHS